MFFSWKFENAWSPYLFCCCRCDDDEATRRLKFVRVVQRPLMKQLILSERSSGKAQDYMIYIQRLNRSNVQFGVLRPSFPRCGISMKARYMIRHSNPQFTPTDRSEHAFYIAFARLWSLWSTDKNRRCAEVCKRYCANRTGIHTHIHPNHLSFFACLYGYSVPSWVDSSSGCSNFAMTWNAMSSSSIPSSSEMMDCNICQMRFREQQGTLTNAPMEWGLSRPRRLIVLCRRKWWARWQEYVCLMNELPWDLGPALMICSRDHNVRVECCDDSQGDWLNLAWKRR